MLEKVISDSKWPPLPGPLLHPPPRCFGAARRRRGRGFLRRALGLEVINCGWAAVGWCDWSGFATEGFEHCGAVSEVLELRLAPFFSGLLSQDVGGGDGWESRGNGRFGQSRIGRRVAVE